MSLKKFGRSDVIRNAMRAYPHNTFFIYSSSVYYDQRPIESGSFSSDVLSSSGGISLFEYNVDKAGTTTFSSTSTGDPRNTVGLTGRNPPIVPYVIKGSSKNYLKSSPRSRSLTEGPEGSYEITASGPMQEVSDDYSNMNTPIGSHLTGSSYAMSASLTRELMTTAGNTGSITNVSRPVYRHYYGLRNTLDFYGTRSPHYLVSFSDNDVGTWNKDEQDLNLISIPKIFYGSRIKHGSMSLKFYVTGTLVGELKDEKYNGELVQVGPEGSSGSGSVAGVALYDEGFVVLTGSWDLTSGIAYDFGGGLVTGSWKYFAAGANDGNSVSTSASFDVSFKGHTETQVLTMYAHARRGEVNYSNNPTFLEFGQTRTFLSSSKLYIENDNQTIKNTVSSSYSGQTADFERQVYISRVAIYDDEKKLIGVATLSNPVLKKEAQDLSFKLKLDL
jgi:hypothetical protein